MFLAQRPVFAWAELPGFSGVETRGGEIVEPVGLTLPFDASGLRRVFGRTRITRPALKESTMPW